jgi:iron complex outermembrane receptor protein
MRSLKNTFLSILFLIPLIASAQLNIKGKVVDKNGQSPLPGVNVVVKGTTNGAVTDFDGIYMINKVNIGDVLVFSFIGYNTLEVPVSSDTDINIEMEESAESLEEVVLIGYGSVQKEDATGSVELLKAKDFNQGAMVSADQLLTGKVAGVRITTNGGQPDAAPNIRIRGGASLNANNNPLIVIDGVPVDNTNPAGVNNPLSLINPNDIESFSILKDASSTAIYGSRASNGVIIITTKKGSSGEPQYNLSTNVALGTVTKTIDVMDGPTFANFIEEYHPDYASLLGVVENGERVIYDTDWQDAIYRTSVSTDVNFSVRANLGKKVPFRGSYGYTKNQGVVKRNDYERFTLSLKLTPTFFDEHLKVDVNFKSLYSNKNAIDEGGALGGVVNMDPTKPIYDNSADNRFGGFYQPTYIDYDDNDEPLFLRLAGQWNPVALLKQRKRPERVYKILGNVEFDYKMHFLPELRAVLNLGLEASQARIREQYTDNSLATYQFNQNDSNINTNYLFNPGINYKESQNITNQTMDAYLVYTKEFEGLIKKFDIQGGYAYQNFKNDGTKEEYRYNTTTGLRELIIDTSNPNNRYFNELNLQSFFGRTNINIDDTYLITLSMRADGSSLFTEDNRWGYFPAAALGWKLNEYDVFDNSNFINELKIRLGWGKTGQQDITGAVGFYPSIPLFEAGSATSQYLAGYALYSAKPYNGDLTWEKTTTYNAGIDFNLFENSLVSGSFDAFYRETSDLLASVPVAPGQGLTDTFVKNVGKTESKGFEFNTSFKPINNENTKLEFYGNIGYSKAEVTDLKDVSRISDDDSGIPTGTGVKIAYHVVGYEPYAAWVFKQLYDNDGNPIHGAFADFNGDGTVDNDDRYYRPMRPNWTFGYGLNLSYKNLDFSTSFRGQYGGQVYNTAKLKAGWIDKAEPGNSNSLSNVLNFYSGAADPNFVNVQGYVPFSDYFLEDASFIRCENIVLTYNFNNLIKNARLRVSGSVNNAFIITKYGGQDPENYNAIDNNFYPRPRTFVLGLNLDF